MTELNVRSIHLEPMRVACASGFGSRPEERAWDHLLAWARQRGLLGSTTAPRFFGHNNPNPSPGSPNYGYDQWMTVGDDVEPTDDVRIKDFPGGTYLVTRCVGIGNLGPTWKRLAAWREDSDFEPAHHQWLEEYLSSLGMPLDDVEMDLYLPVVG